MASLLLAVLLFFSFLAFKVASSIWRSRRFNSFEKAHGCQKPHNLSGNWPWPISTLHGIKTIRRMLKLKTSGEDILDDIVQEQFKDAHTVSQVGFEGSTFMTTIEPRNVQAMLATQFADFAIGQRRINQFYPLLGKSIFSSDGAAWSHSRALFRPQFIRENINDLEETEDATKMFIEAIGTTDSSGWTQVRQLQPLLYNFTLDTATSFLFGESINSQSLMMHAASATDSGVSQDQARQKQFMTDFEKANIWLLTRIRLQTMYWLSDGLELRRAVARIREYIERFVQKALSASHTKQPDNKKYNLLSALAEQTQDREELRNQLLAILVAGRDTTAGLLGWSFTRLALHPQIFTKLRNQILTDFPPNTPITFEKVKGCRYLQHFLNEVLRLHPNVPFNNRQATVDTTLPVGGGPNQTAPIAVPKGTTVSFSVYLMHRRKDLWGEDALDFRPERWEEKIPPWQFLPFSGGPRVCLGQQFALVEASFVIVRMLQHFDAIEPADVTEMSRLRKGMGLTMWPGDGVPVKLHKA